jgi:hypothetical protein
MLLFLCFLISCSRDCKITNKVSAEVDANFDIQRTSLFDECTDILDGAYAERYAAELYAAYLSTDTLDFMRLLSQQEINRIKK